MRARIASASGVALLLIALLSPAFPVVAGSAKAVVAATTSERAMPMARHAAREPLDATRAADLAVTADVAVMVEPLARAGDAASRLAAIAPPSTPALRMLALINASRVAGGLIPLTIDDRASAAARSHSAVESRFGYVYHDGPDGTAASRNVPACGTGWYGENTGKIWNDNVTALHVEFISEPWAPINHRTNIMDPAFRRVGIGAVQGRDALYMTMVFCR